MKRIALFVGLYLLAIVAANTTLMYQTFGTYTIIINSILFIGFDQTSRDYLHEYWHGNPAKILALILMGGALTLLLSAGSGAQIVFASVVAFVVSGVLDSVSYAIFKQRIWKVNGSNIISATMDSLIFPVLAGFGFSWQLWLLLSAAKIIGGALWYLMLEHTETTIAAPVRSGNSTDVA